MKNLQWKIILVLALTAIAIYGIYPPDKKIKLGLDLKGGIHLVAEVKLEEAVASYTDQFIERLRSELQEKGVTVGNILRQENSSFTIEGIPADKEANVKKIMETHTEWDLSPISGGKAVAKVRQQFIATRAEDAVKLAVQIIRDRVNQFGVSEAIVQREGITGGRLIIQLPGVEDTDRVKSLIQGTAKLDLKLVTGGPAPTEQALLAGTNGQVPPGQEVVAHTGLRNDGSSYSEYLLVQRQAIISGDELQSAGRSTDEYGRPAVSFTIRSGSADKFGKFTESNIGKNLAIILDNKIQSFPTINARITNSGIITGQFTIEEANDLGVMLQSGALPAGLRFLEQRVVGPYLGLDSIRKGLMACAIGALSIVIFMIFYYKLSGVNAIVALVLNMLYLLAFLSYFQATLTLPGIAGIVLSIGMAVDANVLIFERIKEDMRLGKTVRSALQSGFAKAFWPIFDSNITTIISALFLFWFGSGPVKGFAVTLIIGIAASMFTAIWVSRLIFDIHLSKQKKVETLSI
ncbi:MAG TPA: protein translocase subunit SecD [Acidobacteriota bacterium]|nr:protein translocase subunit SecD [Acidobacteriota bacterium]